MRSWLQHLLIQQQQGLKQRKKERLKTGPSRSSECKAVIEKLAKPSCLALQAMRQDGLVLVFSLQPWQEHCRASACTRTQWEPLPSTGNTELMLLERQQLPRIPGAFVERFFSSTAKSLPICKEQTQSKGSCEAGFPLYQILAKKAFPAPRCCDDSIRG